MKKSIFAVFAALLMVFPFFNTNANAETVDTALREKALAHFQDEHYDFREGTFNISKVSNFKVDSSKDKDFSEVTMALAHYDTIRDGIFVTSHTEIVYFNPEDNTLLSETDVADLQPAKQYKEEHSDVTGGHLDYVVIMLLLALILVIPLLLATFWAKTQYSTLRWKIPNNVYETNSNF
ncbi:hypothetical protein [Pseudalkalibacillus caeni]|uniref:Uncharacterized protein n=1 Tax=Exobacillus caeni TaxID=2574798 RepID=A0A5R9FBM1_9BACL|nr:hypothetical protein [Pseudalkalibacillus caeni]TLS39068.1 hypothetical protein FCL54_01800 [Pseudalkalibacillus caeni]